MKQTKLFLTLCASALLSIGALTGCSGNNAADEYDEKGLFDSSREQSCFGMVFLTQVYDGGTKIVIYLQ